MRILLVLFSLCLYSNSDAAIKVCFHKRAVCFDVTIAKGDQQLRQGLMYRSQLSPKQGMLFIYSQPMKMGFWMKNMRFPLDIIWLDAARKVIHIQHRAIPCTQHSCPVYEPTNNASYTLEINAGFAKRYQIKAGDEADFIGDLFHKPHDQSNWR